MAGRAHFVSVVLAVGLMLGGQTAASSGASLHHPSGDFEQFADCPLATLAIKDCVFATVNGGSATVGRRTVVVNKALVLQGGFYRAPGGESLVFVGAEDGNTLSSTLLSVPGGITGLIPAQYLPGWLNQRSSGSLTDVAMVLQLARPASDIRLSTENFLFQEGIALQLPLRIKLSNPFLGENCYIGSSSQPVLLSLTTGITSPPAPGVPIRGTAGVVGFADELQLTTLAGGRLVDNSFAAPQATGCGLAKGSTIDRALNASIGLPSPAGRNTVILNGVFEIATSKAVRSSE